jgi:hypothetical protein
VTRTSNVTLRLTVRNERVDLTFTQQSDILTKDETTLILSVRNSGTEELKDVRLSFKNNTIRLKDHDELKFGDIRPGQNVTATGIAYADLPPGINLVDTEVSWIEKDVQKEESRKIPITISSDADVGVYLEGRPLPLMIGSNHTISTLVSNFGSYKIENVDVSIESPALSSMDISDKQYIGGLQTDDFSTVQFSMKVNATSEGEYPVYITINYRDQSGEWKQKRITQSINVYAPIQIQQSPIPIIFGALVMLALIVWYFMFRKVQE